jgi:hypothetical protein
VAAAAAAAARRGGAYMYVWRASATARAAQRCPRWCIAASPLGAGWGSAAGLRSQLAAARLPPQLLTSPDNHLVLLVCYSDDIDAVGEQMSDIQYVQAEFHKRFGVTTSSPDFMLGVRRTFSTEGDTRVLEFSMPDYIENTYARFEHLMAKFKIRNNRDTPLPEGTVFGPKQPDYDPDPAEQHPKSLSEW